MILCTCRCRHVRVLDVVIVVDLNALSAGDGVFVLSLQKNLWLPCKFEIGPSAMAGDVLGAMVLVMFLGL